MADNRLTNFVSSLADADHTFSEHVWLVVVAALEGSNDLADVLGDDATSSELVESLTDVEEMAQNRSVPTCVPSPCRVSAGLGRR